MIAALSSRVCSFFSPATVTMEEALVEKKVIDISGTTEVQVCDQRFVQELPTVRHIWMTGTIGTNEGKTNRGLPLCLVLGPSGSGKTFLP